MTLNAETTNPQPQLLTQTMDHCTSPPYGQLLSESEYGNLLSPERTEEQTDENTNTGGARRSSWMTRSPFRKTPLNDKHNNNSVDRYLEAVLSPGSAVSKSPLRGNHEAGATTPPKKMQLGEKLMNSITKRASKMMQDSDSASDAQTEEGIDDVYDNVEALLEVFRTERHQEKLRAEEEIRRLREQLAVYENTTTTSNENLEDIFFNTGTSQFATDELTQCLQETMALLEEECLEWQSTITTQKPRLVERRLSLDNITNQKNTSKNLGKTLSTPSPQKMTRIFSTNQTPRQKELVKSLQRLRAVSSRLQQQQKAHPNLAVTALDFDKEVLLDLDYSDHSDETVNEEEDPMVEPGLLGLRLLEDTVEPSNTSQMVDPKLDCDEHVANMQKTTEELEDEIYYLRQHLWDQMVSHGIHQKQLEEQVTRQTSQKVEIHVQLENLKKELQTQVRELQREKDSRLVLQKQLELARRSSQSMALSVDSYRANIEDVNQELEVLRMSSKKQLAEKDAQIDHIEKEVEALQNVQGDANSGRRFETFPQQPDTPVKLSLHNLLLQMQVGVEQHAVVKARVQLESAHAKLEAQTQEMDQLRKNLAASKRQARLHATQADFLSDELQQARLEARESVEARTYEICEYRKDLANLRDDLNISFCRL